MSTYADHQAVEFGVFVTLVGREARGAVYEAMLGVAWSVSNRVAVVSKKPNFWDWGTDWLSVMAAKEQYSSMVPPIAVSAPYGPVDPNLVVYPNLAQNAWQMVLSAAEEGYWRLGTDPTDGAVSYFSPPANPSWASSPLYAPATNIAPFKFFKLAGT